MNKDRIIELAREAGFFVDNDVFKWSVGLFKRFAAPVEAEVRGDAEPVAYEIDQELWAADAPDINNWIRKNGRPLYRHPTPAVVRQLVVSADRLRLCARYINNEQLVVGEEELVELKAALAAAKEAGL